MKGLYLTDSQLYPVVVAVERVDRLEIDVDVLSKRWVRFLSSTVDLVDPSVDNSILISLLSHYLNPKLDTQTHNLLARSALCGNAVVANRFIMNGANGTTVNISNKPPSRC